MEALLLVQYNPRKRDMELDGTQFGGWRSLGIVIARKEQLPVRKNFGIEAITTWVPDKHGDPLPDRE